jgi:hypothetical protein
MPGDTSYKPDTIDQVVYSEPHYQACIVWCASILAAIKSAVWNWNHSPIHRPEIVPS